MEIGSLAELIGGVASIAAAGVSIAALIVAQKANTFARDANDMSRETVDVTNQMRVDTLDQARLARRTGVATELQAWWVGSDNAGWGVEVVNGSNGAAVFRDIRIEATSNSRVPPIRIAVLPPGRYFVRAKKPAAWDLPKPISHDDNLQPITKSPNHLVTAMTFCDPLGTSWRWEADNGLTEMAPA